MPKKRHSTLYSKPQSTAHRSLSSAAGSLSTSGRGDEAPTVAELLATLRASSMSSERQQAPPVIAPSLPSEIRQLLNHPDIPPPQPRSRRRLDVEGRRLPAGPAPPSSWLTTPRPIPTTRSTQENDVRRNLYEIERLPGIAKFPGHSSLMATCLRHVARDWSFQREYNRYYLATLPTKVRMVLLSYIAFYGPEEGVGYQGLRSILHPCEESIKDFSGNDDFQRLDLSGSMGHSISFRQLQELIVPHESDIPTEESWDTENRKISPSLTTPIHSLKMLSLSNPPRTISWTKLLSFATHVPTVTHLSLANWPTPTLTPNSTTATISSRYSSTLDYSGTTYYSHTLDADWSEAASILRRLSTSLYSLEYLDIDACNAWSFALRYSTLEAPGIDWKGCWGKVRQVSLRSGIELLSESVRQTEIVKYKCLILNAMELEKHIRKQRGWIAVVHDEWRRYDRFWTEAGRLGSDMEREYRNAREGRDEAAAVGSLTRTRSIGQLRRRTVGFWD